MNTESKKSELISALIDGQLSLAESQQVLSELTHEPSDKVDWNVYHQIGDVLRSDDLAVSFSPDFSNRFSALLDQEPVVLAPRANGVVELSAPELALVNGANGSVGVSGRPTRFWGVGGLIAASVLIFAVAPRLNNDTAHRTASSTTSVQMAQTRGSINMSAPHSGISNVSNQALLTFEKPDVIPMQMLRDPQLDNFLMGHQKGSSAFGNAPRFGVHNDSNERNERIDFPQSVSIPYFNSQSPAASSVPTSSSK